MLKKLLLFAAAAALAIPFLKPQATAAAEAAPKNTEIVIHKRINRDIRTTARPDDEWGDFSWNYNNTGELLDQIQTDNTFGLNGATFKLFDATSAYNEARAKGQPVKAFVDEWANKKRSEALKEAEADFATIAEQTTETSTVAGKAEDGIARFTVPTKVGDQYAAYLIIETGVGAESLVNVDLSRKAAPLMVVLPQRNSANEYLSTIHIYSKNIGYVRDPYFFKFGRTATGEDVRLEGAVFALYEIQNGQKRYLSMSEVTDLKNEWVESADPLNDDKVNKFISDKDGLVNTGERFLPSGTYYFEELRSVPGYVNDLGDKGVKVEIPTSWEKEDGSKNPVLINGEPMDETESGVVLKPTIEKGRPRVYNARKTDPFQPTTPTTPAAPTTPDKPSSGRLPQTGNLISFAMIALGMLLMLFAWRTTRRHQLNR
ncbi:MULTISPECIES: pilin N-terminal domain-containing protein [unclassified Lacticaseibacillus]|uniref:pilin N-terminal domain-containing protein n=1 Tax=unclassified Lacticaseibacillus TaxID=2759744 RepID=UPI00194591A5|nr:MULTISPECIES: pilin N-terminal domain-containing protein [unclassified Lacticaseibacillus]